MNEAWSKENADILELLIYNEDVSVDIKDSLKTARILGSKFHVELEEYKDLFRNLEAEDKIISKTLAEMNEKERLAANEIHQKWFELQIEKREL